MEQTGDGGQSAASDVDALTAPKQSGSSVYIPTLRTLPAVPAADAAQPRLSSELGLGSEGARAARGLNGRRRHAAEMCII